MRVQCVRSVWAFSVDVQCGRSVWTFSVGVHCGRSLWTVSVDVQCGRSVWTFAATATNDDDEGRIKELRAQVLSVRMRINMGPLGLNNSIGAQLGTLINKWDPYRDILGPYGDIWDPYRAIWNSTGP